MYEDVISLTYFMKEWENKKLSYHKYFQEYLNILPDYKKKFKQYNNIKDKIASLQKVIKSTEIYLESNFNDKKAKREHVDAIYEYYLLKEEFEKLRDELIYIEKELERVFKKVFLFSALVFTHAGNSYLTN